MGFSSISTSAWLCNVTGSSSDSSLGGMSASASRDASRFFVWYLGHTYRTYMNLHTYD